MSFTDKDFEFYTEYCDKIGDDAVKAEKNGEKYCLSKAVCGNDCRFLSSDKADKY